jgi:hypothetical protein
MCLLIPLTIQIDTALMRTPRIAAKRVTTGQFFDVITNVALTSQAPAPTNMIVLGQYFFSPQQFVLDSLGVTAAQFQGITLVHEALHSYSGLARRCRSRIIPWPRNIWAKLRCSSISRNHEIFERELRPESNEMRLRNLIAVLVTLLICKRAGAEDVQIFNVSSFALELCTRSAFQALVPLG